MTKFLLTVESAPCGWGWTRGLSRFPGWGNLCLCFGVELDLISLESKEASNSEFCGVYVFGMALGSLCFSVQGCAPVLLED